MSIMPSRRDLPQQSDMALGGPAASVRNVVPLRPLTVLIAVPTLDAGAADYGALEAARVLAGAGHKPIVVANGGRLAKDVLGVGGDLIRLNVASRNPLVMARNCAALIRIARERRCDVLHAHGRAPAWCAYVAARRTGLPFLTSWYKGFREQNLFKHLYNSVMARGERVIAASEQIAQLINDRHATPWARIAVVPGSVDVERFDIARMTPERIEAIRTSWGVGPETKVIVVVGRMLRRKGHHVMVRAVQRLKERGLKDFLCVFVGEDRGQTQYTGELWDLVLSTDTAGVIRMGRACDDLPAAYAAASVVVSAAVQPEGMQRAILEAQAMARPVVVSELGAGADVVLSPPLVPEHQITGLRFASDDDTALADTLLHLFSMPEATRNAIGARGRDWVSAHFSQQAVAEQLLAIYAEMAARNTGHPGKTT
ncbi:MAG TPA: glycosyltransferase [Pseudolabrys sp.]|nr:glycosyltransferase [Pseudolabrys sp.]